jgi:hypothetical protein
MLESELRGKGVSRMSLRDDSKNGVGGVNKGKRRSGTARDFFQYLAPLPGVFRPTTAEKFNSKDCSVGREGDLTPHIRQTECAHFLTLGLFLPGTRRTVGPNVKGRNIIGSRSQQR